MKKNVFIIILAITTAIFIGTTVFFAVKSNEEKNVSQENVDNKKESNVATTIEKEIVVKEYVSTLEPNPEKWINKPMENAIFGQVLISDENKEISCSVNSDKKSVSILFNKNEIKSVYGKEISENYRCDIDGFSGEIIDISVENLGVQEVERGLVILCLMKDGTVEYYYPIKDALINNNFKSNGKIQGVSEIVKLGFVVGIRGGVGVDPIAIKADGSFYGLTQLIYDKLSY